MRVLVVFVGTLLAVASSGPVCGAAPGFAPGTSDEPARSEVDNVMRVYPDSHDMWTGTLYYHLISGRPPVWECWYSEASLHYGYQPESAGYQEWYGLMKFSLAGVPDSARLTRALLGYYQTADEQSRTTLRLSPTDPDSMEAYPYWNYWYDGSVTADPTEAVHGVGWVRRALRDTALRWIENRLETNDIVVAVLSSSSSGQGWADGYMSLRKPYLELGYYLPRESDVTPTALLAPYGAVDTMSGIVPRVVVQNCGTSSAGFPVRLSIGDSYSDSQYVVLAPQAGDTVEFRTWLPSPLGRLPVRCTTMLAGDSVPGNDLLTDSVDVVPFLGVCGSVPVRALLLDVRPNPSPRGRVSVRWSGSVHAPAMIDVVDASGRVVVSRSVGPEPDGALSTQLQLTPGVYLVRLACGTLRTTARLVVY